MDDEWDDEDDCGALFDRDGDEILAWQHCSRAGSEFCQFDCPLARRVYAALKRAADTESEERG